MQDNSISAIELADFTVGSAATRQRFIKALGDSFSRIGFASIACPAIDDALQKRLFDEIAAFFALPVAVKNKYIVPHAGGQRGYNPFRSEQAKGESQPDLKEFWHHGQDHDPRDPLSQIDFANVDVAERPQLTPTLRHTYRALEDTGRQLLCAIALYLDLPEHFFDDKVKGGLSILRAIHYPPITTEPKGAIRAAAHEDIDLITLLMGASAEGLEVKTFQGEWLAVQTPPGYLTLNVGDMLQRLTNQRLVSTTHRVVNPPREAWGSSRISVPFFMHPRPEMSLACLPGCIDRDHPKRFDDISAKDYLQERLREIRAM